MGSKIKTGLDCTRDRLRKSDETKPLPSGTIIARRALPNKELVRRVREAFPDKYQGFGIEEASKGKHTAYTGLQYCDDIKRLAMAPVSRRSDFRSLPCKFTWRCTEALKVRLQIAKRAFGEDCTFQEFITVAMLNELERIEGKRKEAEWNV